MLFFFIDFMIFHLNVFITKKKITNLTTSNKIWYIDAIKDIELVEFDTTIYIMDDYGNAGILF